MHITHNKSLGLLILRIIIGLAFIMSGYMKLHDMPMTIGYFAQMGFAPFLAYFVAWVEVLGGISLLVGYGSKIASALLSIIMIVAFYETIKMTPEMAMMPLVTFGGTAAIFFAGPGRYGFGSSCGCPTKACPVEAPKMPEQK